MVKALMANALRLCAAHLMLFTKLVSIACTVFHALTEILMDMILVLARKPSENALNAVCAWLR